jgi:hypothetical protein
MVLFGLTFQPSGIEVSQVSDALKNLPNVTPEMRKLGEGAIPYDGGLYPWEWVRSEMPSFQALQGGLLVAPILQKLILNRDPTGVIEWADKVSKWPIRRIIPCHFANDVRANGKEFRAAFAFLEKKKGGRRCPAALEADAELLTEASSTLTKLGVVYPEGALV